MGTKTKLEYLAAIFQRYLKAGRERKTQILNEFCAICGYHRKHAIRLLSQRRKGREHRPGRPSQYGEQERSVLEVIWLAANRPCSVRLKAALETWLPWYEVEYGRLTAAAKDQLARISPRTLDRLMKPVRKRHGSRGKCGTRPGTLLRNQIPIKTEHADVTKPGVMEADTVAHSGVSLAGDFIWSLTLTDIYSGWTENRAVWNKGYEGIKEAIHDIERNLPFQLTGFHSDNGGEFLNHHLVRYFQDREVPVFFSRGRPYHKDDNSHVEQKNYTHVRMLLGYQRMEDPDLIKPTNQLYQLWDLYNNFYSTSLKLVKKTKEGSHYSKTYDGGKTPYQRLMDSPDVPELTKTYLTETIANVNPFKLKHQIDFKQGQILALLR